MQGEKKNIQTLIIVLFIRIIILNHSAYGQFHWGGIHWKLVKVLNKYFGVFGYDIYHVKHNTLNNLFANNLIQYYILAISSTSYLRYSTGIYGFRQKDIRTNCQSFSIQWPISCKKENTSDNAKERG